MVPSRHLSTSTGEESTSLKESQDADTRKRGKDAEHGEDRDVSSLFKLHLFICKMGTLVATLKI